MLQRFNFTTRHAIYCGILFSAGLVSAGLTPANATDPTGDWQVEDAVANIRVAECNGSMWGAVSWEKRVGGVDKNNPDVSKRNRPTLGMVTLIDMKKNPKADEWKGKVYDAKDSGKLYDATIRPKGPDELEIEGCLVWPLCGSQTWTRVSPPIPSSPTNPPKGAATPAPAKPGILARITGTAPKAAAPAAPATGQAAAPAAAPKAPPPATAVAGSKAPGQKTAAATTATGQPADIGDICLLPEIARPAR